MSWGRNAVIALAFASALSACSGSEPATVKRPTPTVTPTSTATTPAGEQLQALAQAGLRASYRATYLVRQDRKGHRADWRVAHTPAALRIDVVTHDQTATLIVGPKGAFSCARSGHRRACFLVAKPGRPVPAPFNHAPQALFTSDLKSLAEHAGSYDVAAVASSAAGGRAGDSCFSIRATSSAPKPQVTTGVYCFAPSGLLTAIRFPTGSTVRLVSSRMAPQPASVFRPYSSPTPIP
ncbi:MAG TPA: hypothetical protein VFH66_05740 [Mycobacteriales bacterium]|nr:hypothetical protein [Mycobacteriales bacterium]